MTTATAEIAGKNLDLIREAFPAVRRVGVIGNEIDPFHKPFLEHVAAAGRALNFEIKIVIPQGSDHLTAAFAKLVKSGVEAVLIQPSLPRELAADTALKSRLPLFAPSAEFALAGALMAYSPDSGASTGNPQLLSTTSAKAESRLTCRSSLRPSSSWSSISKPRTHSALRG